MLQGFNGIDNASPSSRKAGIEMLQYSDNIENLIVAFLTEGGD